jgi:hypothetical protein
VLVVCLTFAVGFFFSFSFSVKMRGYAAGPTLSPNFFIVMDRLYETLEERFKVWASMKKEHNKMFRKNERELRNLLTERMIVAYDLAAAFSYMHDSKYVRFPAPVVCDLIE